MPPKAIAWISLIVNTALSSKGDCMHFRAPISAARQVAVSLSPSLRAAGRPWRGVSAVGLMSFVPLTQFSTWVPREFFGSGFPFSINSGSRRYEHLLISRTNIYDEEENETQFGGNFRRAREGSPGVKRLRTTALTNNLFMT